MQGRQPARALRHGVGRSLALAYVPKDLARASSGFEVELIGERRPAKRLDGAAYDPRGIEMRA